MKNLGQIAYNAYFSAMYPGTAIPPMTDEHSQEAWTAAAEAVVRQSSSSEDRSEKPDASFPEPDACAGETQQPPNAA